MGEQQWMNKRTKIYKKNEEKKNLSICSRTNRKYIINKLYVIIRSFDAILMIIHTGQWLALGGLLHTHTHIYSHRNRLDNIIIKGNLERISTNSDIVKLLAMPDIAMNSSMWWAFAVVMTFVKRQARSIENQTKHRKCLHDYYEIRRTQTQLWCVTRIRLLCCLFSYVPGQSHTVVWIRIEWIQNRRTWYLSLRIWWREPRTDCVINVRLSVCSFVRSFVQPYG